MTHSFTEILKHVLSFSIVFLMVVSVVVFLYAAIRYLSTADDKYRKLMFISIMPLALIMFILFTNFIINKAQNNDLTFINSVLQIGHVIVTELVKNIFIAFVLIGVVSGAVILYKKAFNEK